MTKDFAMLRNFLACLVVTLLAGCALHTPERFNQLSDAYIDVDTIWQGRVLIDGSVKVAKGTTLTIKPGTEISFSRQDKNADGLGDGTLIIEGRIVAIGSESEPIVFRSAERDPQPGDWLEIRADFATEVIFKFCEIRDSAYTLHAHFSKGSVEDCTIRFNIDGCRLGESHFSIRNNLFEKNEGKAINFRNSEVEISRNIVRDNGSGIFVFETNRIHKIEQNNVYDNVYNIRLGDFFTGNVRLQSNWWGTNDSARIEEKIYDSRVDPEIGTVYLSPAKKWIEGSGPRNRPAAQRAGYLKSAVSSEGSDTTQKDGRDEN